MIPTLEWTDEGVRFLDQTKLPLEEVYVNTTSFGEVGTVIRDMIVRGAPAIGVAAGMGMALGIDRSKATGTAELSAEVDVMADTLARTRPTAVNLFWGIERIRSLYKRLLAEQPANRSESERIAAIKAGVVAEAKAMYDEDIAACKTMGQFGADLLPQKGTVLTHCNAGALATCGYGSALGVIRAAVERGFDIDVLADETRPFLQGARLTAWELMTPDGVGIENPAFDVTPAKYVTAIITERGLLRAPYGAAIAAMDAGGPLSAPKPEQADVVHA